MVYVYFIQQWESATFKGPVKIGIADDVEARLADLQVGNPRRLTIMAKLPMPTRAEAYATEQDLHRRFDHLRIRGEWFHGKIVKAIRQQSIIAGPSRQTIKCGESWGAPA